MASASAPARELVVQLPAPASSLAVPPPPASTAEAVGLPAGAAILEDPRPAAGAAGAAPTRAGFLPHSRCMLFFFYRPKDGKEDLGTHAYAIRNSSHSFHARVHGDFSVSIRL